MSARPGAWILEAEVIKGRYPISEVCGVCLGLFRTKLPAPILFQVACRHCLACLFGRVAVHLCQAGETPGFMYTA